MRKTSVIPEGVTLVGDVEGDADLVVLGRVEGPIHVGGALVIEGSGVVRGHVRARSVVVRGVLKGNAFGDELVRVDEGARLVGELTAPRVHVVPGAQFRGQIHVGQVGEPRLSTYDPSLHTFSGWPSPEPIARATAPAPPPAFHGDETLSEARPASSFEPHGEPSFEPRVEPRVEPSFASFHDAGSGEPGALELAPTEAAHDATLSEATHEHLEPTLSADSSAVTLSGISSPPSSPPPPPERLPPSMPRLGRTRGTRRWS